jgi:hypothetical protein
MQFRKTPIALALVAAAPLAAIAAPTLTIDTPSSGQTLSGRVSGTSCAVTATATGGVSRVTFWANDWQINNDYSSPYNCDFDTTRLRDGTYTFKAVAYANDGSSTTKTTSITVRNSGSTTTSTTTTPTATTTPTTSTTTSTTSSTTLPAPGTGTLEVWFKSPLSGATVSGVLQKEKCYVAGRSVGKVAFSVGSTALNTDTAVTDGMSCVLDTTKLANGTHTLKAVAYNTAGTATYTEQISIKVQNGTATTTPTATTPPATTTPTTNPTTPVFTPTNLPSTNTKAVPTYESIGLYWKPPSNPGSAGCSVRFRQAGTSAWRNGYAMWYDSRNSECRGSLVHLSPGTGYEVQFSMPGQSPVAQVNATTWREAFPIAKTIHVPSGAGTFTTPEGGSASGYVLYTSAPGSQTVLDAGNSANFNVVVNKPYVIVRGLVMKGAKQDAVSLQNGARDVVIEGNDISGWGRFNYTNSGGWQVGVDMDSGVRAACRNFTTPMERVTIQRNRIHDPRYGANSWSWGHPAGPQGITFSYCGGNHVMRYNEIYSGDPKRSFNDGIGGEDNFSATGFPTADTDIYGNKIQNTWDDGIEAEGGNKNVRIWGNYIDQTAIGIASTVVHHGPLYIFRNVYNRSRHFSEKPLDSDERNTFLKAGTHSSYGGGRRFVFHNTTLQATQAGVSNPLGAGHGLKGNTGQPLTNTVSRNNIFHVWKSGAASIIDNGGTGNSLDYDLRNGGLSVSGGGESNGQVGFPTYAAGHGWQSESGGYYQLAPGTAGYDRAQRLANFNDGFLGAAPDVGAHEGGTAKMQFGVDAIGATPGTAPGAGSFSIGTSTGTSSSGSVCASALCVLSQ